MMSGVSTTTGAVDSVMLFIMGVSIFFMVLITGLMIYFIYKYNKKRHAVAVDIEGNTMLEIVWTVIPTLIVLAMFYFGWKGFEVLRNTPDGAMTVKVTARMWSWMFEYENGAQTSELTVPVNRPVKLLLTSQDVLHSFYVPAFRIKEDAVPNFESYLWFDVNTPGEYDVMCAEYCGLQHAYMLTKIHAVPEDEFNAWYAKIAEGVVPDTAAVSGDDGAARLAAAGKRLAEVKGCVACHSSDGSKLIGPSFKGLFGRQNTIVANGKESVITVDEDYLRKSITAPNAEVVKGFQALMPPQQFTQEELDAIVEYLKQN